MTVASYGGRQPSRILDPQVVGTPSGAHESLSASGTPASGPSCSPAARAASTARGCGERAVGVDVQEGVDAPSSTAAMRSRCAWATSTALRPRRRRRAAAVVAASSASGRPRALTPRPGCAARGSGRPRRPGRRTSACVAVSDGRTTSARKTLFSGSGWEVGGTSSAATSATWATAPEDHAELAGVGRRASAFGEVEPRQPGQVGDLVARDPYGCGSGMALILGSARTGNRPARPHVRDP